MERKYTIAVVGTGYVGLSIATLLAQHHKVYALDIVQEKVDLINDKKSPIQDDYIESYLKTKELDLTATVDSAFAYTSADFVVVAVPTNYDTEKNYFDTSAVEQVVKSVIHHNTNRQYEGQHRQVVDREAKQREKGKRTQDRNRNSQDRNERGPPAL